MDLSCPKRPLNISNIGEIRWYMFSKFQYESEKLPPTKSTLREKIFRWHYTSLIWKSAHLPSPVLLDPKQFGWRWDSSEKSYESIMTKHLLLLTPLVNYAYVNATQVVPTLGACVKKQHVMYRNRFMGWLLQWQKW